MNVANVVQAQFMHVFVSYYEVILFLGVFCGSKHTLVVARPSLCLSCFALQ